MTKVPPATRVDARRDFIHALRPVRVPCGRYPTGADDVPRDGETMGADWRGDPYILGTRDAYAIDAGALANVLIAHLPHDDETIRAHVLNVARGDYSSARFLCGLLDLTHVPHPAAGGMLQFDYEARNYDVPDDDATPRAFYFRTRDTSYRVYRADAPRAVKLKNRMLRRCRAFDRAALAQLNASLPHGDIAFGFVWELRGRSATTGRGTARRQIAFGKGAYPISGQFLHDLTHVVDGDRLPRRRATNYPTPETARLVRLYCDAFNAITNARDAMPESKRRRPNYSGRSYRVSLQFEGETFEVEQFRHDDGRADLLHVTQRIVCAPNPHWRETFYRETTLRRKYGK